MSELEMMMEEHKAMEDELDKYQRVLADAGICPVCLIAPDHDITEPFSSCKCGAGEDYGERPMQRLQILEYQLNELKRK